MVQGHEKVNFGVRKSKVKVVRGWNRSQKSWDISRTIWQIFTKHITV